MVLVAFATIAGAFAAFALSAIMAGQEGAAATLVLTGPGASRERQMTYAEILLADAFLERPAAALGLDPDDLRDTLRAIPAPGTFLIRLEARAGNKDEAVRRVRTVSEAFVAYLDQTGLATTSAVAIASPARPDSSSNPGLAAALAGGAAGFLSSVTILSLSRPASRAALLPPRETGVPGGTDDDKL